MRKKTLAGYYQILPRCKTCKYRGTDNGPENCNYILATGEMRGCDPEDCYRYEKGNRVKWKEDDESDPKGWPLRKNT